MKRERGSPPPGTGGLRATAAHDAGFQNELRLGPGVRTPREGNDDTRPHAARCARRGLRAQFFEKAAQRRDGGTGTHAAGTVKRPQMFARE